MFIQIVHRNDTERRRMKLRHFPAPAQTKPVAPVLTQGRGIREISSWEEPVRLLAAFDDSGVRLGRFEILESRLTPEVAAILDQLSEALQPKTELKAV